MDDDRAEQDRLLSLAFEGERRRLRTFIRRRVPTEIDAEDILQDVFCELVEAYRAMKPIAHAGAWMMQVAKNRITDLFRRGKREAAEDEGGRLLEDLLPSPNAGPEALEQCKEPAEREFYLRRTKQFGWSKNVLIHRSYLLRKSSTFSSSACPRLESTLDTPSITLHIS